MHKASYIITWRDAPGTQRRENLFTVLAWLERFSMFEPIVVEQDDTPRLQEPLPCGSHLFAYNPGPFNKSWGLNVGFRASRSPWLAFADADILLGDVLPETLDYFAQGYQAVKPYRRLIDLDPEQSVRVRAGDFGWQPSRDDESDSGRDGIGERLSYAGGAFLVTRATFVALGGWDERFVGWGGEDDAMSHRLERARVPAIELDRRVALHLHHPRSATTDQPHYAANCALLSQYTQLDDAQLARFSEIQVQVIGRREKYRPQ